MFNRYRIASPTSDRKDNPYRPSMVRAEELHHNQSLGDDKYEIAEDMAFTELVSGVTGGGDAFHVKRSDR